MFFISKIFSIQHAANHTTCKRISSSHSVYDRMNGIFLGMIEFLTIIDCCRPAVIGCGITLTKGTYYVLKSETVNHLLEDILVACKLKITACNICITGFEAENLLCILFVTDTYILPP